MRSSALCPRPSSSGLCFPAAMIRVVYKFVHTYFTYIKAHEDNYGHTALKANMVRNCTVVSFTSFGCHPMKCITTRLLELLYNSPVGDVPRFI